MTRLWKWKVPEYQPDDPEHWHRQVGIIKMGILRIWVFLVFWGYLVQLEFWLGISEVRREIDSELWI